ncbi:hypothetical protein DFH09DRAFT_658144 [Mycena vulgaris]|nr:hypothetical protein DFH09DRAFT_658144 [Mycena vulgaris]
MSHDDDWRDIFRYDSHSDGQSTLESLHQVCAQFIETQVDGRTTVRRHGEWTALRRHGELQLSASPLSLDTPFSALYPRPTIPPVVRPSLPNIEPVSRKPWTIDSSEEEEEDYLHGPKLKQGSPNRPSFPSGDHRKSLHLSIPSLSISYDSHNTKHHRLSDGDVRGVPAYTSHGSPPIYTSHASPSSTSPAVKRSRSAEGWSDSERDVVLISSHIPD